ncbi:phage tail assembly chaperone [Polaromonas sp.]|uniref:phage tail assembly chaperone n=1 Tax=Polaromonas sp. TaxID=1869339 RepID=UPI003750E5E7
MPKLVIGKAPASFPLNVKIKTPQGEDEICFEAKHHPATEWAKLREAHVDAVNKQVSALFDAARKEAENAFEKKADTKALEGDAKEAAIEALRKPVKDSEISVLRAKFAAALILKIANKWDLEDEFTEPSLVQMCDLYANAPEAIFKAYSEALSGARLGN